MNNIKTYGEEKCISVITVVYNGVTTIEETICSVINQTYTNIEYIIIDGGSTDGTVDIIKKYSDKISYWISEPDKGIYDAMNKGIKIATGDWVSFMNSGDIFSEKNIIQKICIAIVCNADIVYGDTLLKYSWGIIEGKASPLDDLESHLPFSHQSCLIKTKLMKESPFDLQYKICADYNFFYSLYKRKACFQYIPLFFSIYEAEQGVSSINILLLQKELAMITGRIDSYWWKVCFACFHLRIKIVNFIKRKLLPQKMVKHYRRKKTLRNLHK